MNHKQMLKELRRRKRKGHRYVPIRIYRRTRPKNWDHVRVFPGVYGKCIGEMDEKHWYLIDVPLDSMLNHVALLSNSEEGNKR